MPLAPPVPPPEAPPPVPLPEAPPLAPLDAPLLDEPDAPADEEPFPCPVEPVVPVVPLPVVPPPAVLPLSLLPPPLFDRVLRPGTDEMPEFVLLGLLLRTQSARAVPVSPAHDAFGVAAALSRMQFDNAVPVRPEQAPVVSVVVVPVADDDVDPLGIDDVPDVLDCANAVPPTTSDVARISAFNFRNFISMASERRKNYNDREAVK